MAKWNFDGLNEEQYTVYMKSSDFERLRGGLDSQGYAPVFFVKGMLTDLVEVTIKPVRRVPSAVPYGEYYDPNV